MKTRISLQPRRKQKDKRSSTEAKAKLELLTKRVWDDADEIEDMIQVEQKEKGKASQTISFEAPDSIYETNLFRKGLGFQQIASRGYAIRPRNVQGYYDLKMQLRTLIEEDPAMKDDLTREVFSLYVNANNNLLQRTITTPQTNVEVVDHEPVVKYITLPPWFKGQETDMGKKEDE